MVREIISWFHQKRGPGIVCYHKKSFCYGAPLFKLPYGWVISLWIMNNDYFFLFLLISWNIPPPLPRHVTPAWCGGGGGGSPPPGWCGGAPLPGESIWRIMCLKVLCFLIVPRKRVFPKPYLLYCLKSKCYYQNDRMVREIISWFRQKRCPGSVFSHQNSLC